MTCIFSLGSAAVTVVLSATLAFYRSTRTTPPPPSSEPTERETPHHTTCRQVSLLEFLVAAGSSETVLSSCFELCTFVFF